LLTVAIPQLGISELIVECEKASANLCENELGENYIQELPFLKTKAESYTRRMYNEFEGEFKSQFSFSYKLLQTKGSISTFMVTHMNSNCDATILFNIADNTIDLLVKGLANPLLHLVQRIYTSIPLFHFDVGKSQ
jgi:hypothetical protein